MASDRERLAGLVYSRADKSLGLLCERFLKVYGHAGNVTISLDAAAVRLGVERRRIYDIVNVLESVEVVVRQQKNQYVWRGLGGLPSTLQCLAQAALADSGAAQASCAEGQVDRVVERKQKSLGVLSQRFIQLFLTGPEPQGRVITLDDAASALSDGDMHGDTAKLKTKVRRLYDIANILSSLGLVEKTATSDATRKPAFRWLGVAACLAAATPPSHACMPNASCGAGAVGSEGSASSGRSSLCGSKRGGGEPSTACALGPLGPDPKRTRFRLLPGEMPPTAQPGLAPLGPGAPRLVSPFQGGHPVAFTPRGRRSSLTRSASAAAVPVTPLKPGGAGTLSTAGSLPTALDHQGCPNSVPDNVAVHAHASQLRSAGMQGPSEAALRHAAAMLAAQLSQQQRQQEGIPGLPEATPGHLAPDEAWAELQARAQAQVHAQALAALPPELLAHMRPPGLPGPGLGPPVLPGMPALPHVPNPALFAHLGGSHHAREESLGVAPLPALTCNTALGLGMRRVASARCLAPNLPGELGMAAGVVPPAVAVPGLDPATFAHLHLAQAHLPMQRPGLAEMLAEYAQWWKRWCPYMDSAATEHAMPFVPRHPDQLAACLAQAVMPSAPIPAGLPRAPRSGLAASGVGQGHALGAEPAGGTPPQLPTPTHLQQDHAAQVRGGDGPPPATCRASSGC